MTTDMLAKWLRKFRPFAGVAVLGALATIPMAAHAAGEVKLIRAQDLAGESAGLEGAHAQNLVFDVVVKNLAFQKQVFVHMQNPCGTADWIDIPGQFVQAADPSGNELWRVGTTVAAFGFRGPFLFVVGYTVGGRTFWDNNNGHNYVLPFSQTDAGNPPGFGYGALLANGTGLLVASATTNGALRGQIQLANLGFQKTVNVVYTTDHWASRQTVAATWVLGPNANGLETWSFTSSLAFAASVEFAVSYQVNGVTFWDNNFTHNYTATSSGANGTATPIPDVTQPFPPPFRFCNRCTEAGMPLCIRHCSSGWVSPGIAVVVALLVSSTGAATAAQ